MIGKVWKTMEGKEVEDVLSVISEVTAGGGKEVHIGSDSQQAGPRTEFVTVIVVLTPGKGGRAFYTRERVPRIKSLRERLMREVWLSIDVGIAVNDRLGDD